MKTFHYYRRHMPHYLVRGATYYITWTIRSELGELSHRERDLVASALRHFQGTRYDLISYVVMNDHVHVVVKPQDGLSLIKILHSWKSFTAKEINTCRDRGGPVWVSESMDRIIRNDADLQEKIAYILNNPWKRWPELEHYPWVELLGPGERSSGGMTRDRALALCADVGLERDNDVADGPEAPSA